MPSISRRTALASAAVLGTGFLASCSGGTDGETQEKIDNPDPNINLEGYPIVKEKTTLRFMSGHPPTTNDDWNEVSAVKKAEEITNIHLDWGLVPLEGVGEKRNLALASGDYPEVFYRTSLSAGDIAKYGEQGVLVPLDDLIERHMPNLTAIMEENPTIRQALTFPDGKIYTLPQIYDKDFVGMRYSSKLWARQDWLDDFGMDVPATLDEFEAFLEEAVRSDPDGAGAIGHADSGSFSTTIPCLYGTFGVGNKGPDVGLVDLDPETEKVRYFPTADGYRELLTYLHRLFEKGLLMEDGFNTDLLKFKTLGTDGLLASCATQTPAGYFGKVGEEYVALAPLKKQSSDDVPPWHAVRSEVAGIGQFAMTDKAEHPVEIARWMDFWFSEEGARMFFMGVEGVSFHEVDGRYELMPEITAGGRSIGEGLQPHALYGGGRYPGRATDEWFRGVENTPQAVEGAELVQQYALDEVWSAFTFTSEESTTLSSIGTDISKHATESRSAFITGQLPLSEWDNYVAKFDQMGMPDYLAAHQAAHERRMEIGG